MIKDRAIFKIYISYIKFIDQSEMTYIGRGQGTVVQWVALWIIFDVCARYTGYK